MSTSRVWLNRLQLVLILLGIGIAGYLTYVKLVGLEPVCGGLGDCESVQSSRYSVLLGVPVAVWGLLSYLALLVIFFVKRSNWRDLGNLARQGFFLVTLIGVVFSAYLTYLEIFVIHAICPWCVASAVVMTILFVLALIDLFGGDDTEAA